MEIDQEEAGAGAILRQHHAHVGRIAVGDRDLYAGELAALHAGLDLCFGEGAGPLIGGEAADHFARGDLRQPRRFLGVRAGQQNRFGDEVDGRSEGDRSQRAAKLLGDGGQFDVTEAKAAVRFRDRGSQPALAADRFPQSLVVGLGRVVEDAAHHGDAAVALEEPARLAFEEFLIVGVVEIHGVSSRVSERIPKTWEPVFRPERAQL